MNLQAIEVVVRRLFSDAEFRAAAIADPATALAEYRLAADERSVLSTLCTQLAVADGPGPKPNLGWWG